MMILQLIISSGSFILVGHELTLPDINFVTVTFNLFLGFVILATTIARGQK